MQLINFKGTPLATYWCSHQV